MTEENTSGEDTGDNEKRTRLSDAEWAEIKELYELGKKRMVELADEYNVSRQTLSKRFKDGNVTYGSRAGEVQAAVNQGVTSAVASTTAAAVAAQIERYSEQRQAWIEETRVTGYKGLKQTDVLAKKIMQDALKTGKPPAVTQEDLKAVQRLQKILVENTLSRLEILKADEVVDEDTLPDIKLFDLTDDDILAHHRNNGLLPEDASEDDLLAELNTYEGL